ncbi:autotransporter outer membrane beta-barrel domain-containing protein, partial [Ralstonia pseudosolanacearum]
TAGAAAAALWTQNTGTSFVSSGGLTLRTTGGYGIVNGLPVGSYGAVASHNSSISLTDATIATTGQGATGAYAYGSRMTLNNVSISTSGLAYRDGTGTYGAYGTLSNFLNNVRGSLTYNNGSITTQGDVAYGLFAIQSDITASNLAITTNGANAYAVFARNGGTISGTDLTVLATGSGGYGA